MYVIYSDPLCWLVFGLKYSDKSLWDLKVESDVMLVFTDNISSSSSSSRNIHGLNYRNDSRCAFCSIGFLISRCFKSDVMLYNNNNNDVE